MVKQLSGSKKAAKIEARTIEPPLGDPRAVFGQSRAHDDQVFAQIVKNERAKQQTAPQSRTYRDDPPVPTALDLPPNVELKWFKKGERKIVAKWRGVKLTITQLPDAVIDHPGGKIKLVGRWELHASDNQTVLWAGPKDGCKFAATFYASQIKDKSRVWFVQSIWFGRHYYNAATGAACMSRSNPVEAERVDLLNVAFCGRLTVEQQKRYAVLFGKEPLQTECLPGTWQGVNKQEKPREEGKPANIVDTYNAYGIDIETTTYPSGRNKWTIFGFPVTGILRWLGHDAWTEEQASDFLRRLGIKDISESTVKTQVCCGRKGDNETFGPLPKLSKEQRRLINKILEMDPLKPKKEKKCQAKEPPARRKKKKLKSSRSPKSSGRTKKDSKSRISEIRKKLKRRR